MSWDPYAVLGVPRGATRLELKRAFHAQAKASHPDLNPGDAAAEARFKDLAAAWAILGDAEARARYDTRPHPPPGFSAPDQGTISRFAEALRTAVDRVDQVFFEAILPRYLEAYERGCGAELVYRLLGDLDDFKIIAFRRDHTPSIGARQRSHTLRGTLRLRLDARVRYGVDGEPVFAELTLVKERSITWAALTVYAGSLLVVGCTEPDDISVKLLSAVGREVVRYLEEKLPPAERPLAHRERTGEPGLPMSLRAARRRDDWVLSVQIIRVLVGVALLATAAGALLWACQDM